TDVYSLQKQTTLDKSTLIKVYIEHLQEYQQIVCHIVDELPFKMLLCPATYTQLGYQLQLLIEVQPMVFNNIDINDTITDINNNTNNITNNDNNTDILNNNDELIVLSPTLSPLPSPQDINLDEQLSNISSSTNSPTMSSTLNMLSQQKSTVTLDNITKF